MHRQLPKAFLAVAVRGEVNGVGAWAYPIPRSTSQTATIGQHPTISSEVKFYVLIFPSSRCLFARLQDVLTTQSSRVESTYSRPPGASADHARQQTERRISIHIRMAAPGNAVHGLDTLLNITPEPSTSWDRANGLSEFATAMREGKTTNGSVYYPAFFYSSYTAMADSRMSDGSISDPSIRRRRRQARPHEFIFRLQYPLLRAILAISTISIQCELADARTFCGRTGAPSRTASRALTAECHITAKFSLGGLPQGARTLRALQKRTAGWWNASSNITPHPKKGIGSWSETSISSSFWRTAAVRMEISSAKRHDLDCRRRKTVRAAIVKEDLHAIADASLYTLQGAAGGRGTLFGPKLAPYI